MTEFFFKPKWRPFVTNGNKPPYNGGYSQTKILYNEHIYDRLPYETRIFIMKAKIYLALKNIFPSAYYMFTLFNNIYVSRQNPRSTRLRQWKNLS